MSIFDARTARALATILVFGLSLIFIWLAWRTLVTFLFAIMFAYLFEPVVRWFQSRLRLQRKWAVALLYVFLAIGLGYFFLAVGPRIAQQAAHLSDLGSNLTARIRSGQIAQEIGSRRGWSSSSEQRLQQFLVLHQDAIVGWIDAILNDFGSLVANSFWVALIPILAIFFLIEGGQFSDLLIEQMHLRQQRAFVAGLLSDIHDVLANYIRGQIILTGLATGVYLIGFSLMHLRYPIALGGVAGALEFIPVVGPLLGAAIVLTTAFLTGYPQLLLVALFLGAWRVEQDYVNSPHIMGHQVKLPPLAVLFGVFVGAEIGGVIGVYLSVPAIATIRVVWLRWRGYQQTPPPGSEPPLPGTAV